MSKQIREKGTPSERRFRKFQQALRQKTGDRCLQYTAGRVMVLHNQFSPERDFHSTQAAIDHFAHLLGTDF